MGRRAHEIPGGLHYAAHHAGDRVCAVPAGNGDDGNAPIVAFGEETIKQRLGRAANMPLRKPYALLALAVSKLQHPLRIVPYPGYTSRPRFINQSAHSGI